MERRLEGDDFLDRDVAERLRGEIRTSEHAARDAQSALEQTRLKLQVARAEFSAARETFNHWLATRRATQLAEQDPELVARTRQLDALRQAERTAEAATEREQQAALDARQRESRVRQTLSEMEQGAHTKLQAEYRRVEVRVFLYGLALTLPLLAVAGWLFRSKRHST